MYTTSQPDSPSQHIFDWTMQWLPMRRTNSLVGVNFVNVQVMGGAPHPPQTLPSGWMFSTKERICGQMELFWPSTLFWWCKRQYSRNIEHHLLKISMQGRIQAHFEIWNCFWAHKNWCPNFDRSTENSC